MSNVAGELWQAARAAYPRVAIVERERSVSYGALRAAAAAVAAALTAVGVMPDEPVAILLERGADAAAAFFGVLATGAVAVVVHEALRPRQIEYVLDHSGARTLITNADLLGRLSRPLACRDPVRVFDIGTLEPPIACPAPVPRRPDDPAQIVYTSGSTGQPKGVALSHRNLLAALTTVSCYLGLEPSDRIASLLPFGFVYGMSQLLCAVHVGATLVIERAPLPQDVARALRAERVTVLAAVPPQWLGLLGAAAFQEVLPALRIMTNAGGPLPVTAVRQLRRAQPQARLFLMYGLTEALRTTYLVPEEVDRHPDSIGRPIPGATVFVLREDGTPALVDEVGELVQCGPTVALGYWRDPDLTAQVFRPNLLGDPDDPASERVVYTGDLVRRDAAGLLYFVGRRDRIIKTLGYRVGPDEICGVLHASGQVADVAVVGMPDAQWGQRIVAYVVLAPGGTLARLQAFAQTELPRYMQPAHIAVLDALPRLPSGKHDVLALAHAAR